MFKTVFKEIVIMILLCIAIALIIGVIFYNYIPNNKAIPNKLSAYTTPENVQKEIEQKIVEAEQEEVSYQIDGADLSLYKQTNGYTTGKINPFAAISTTSNVEDPEAGGSLENITGGENTTNIDPNSISHFFNDNGLK